MILIAAVAGWLALVPWIPFFPQPLGRHLTEWFLRGLLVGYAATLSMASLGAVGLAVYVLRGRRRRVRRPIAARLWLLCAASLISLGGVELAAAVWLAWLHRLPVLPTRLAGAAAGRGVDRGHRRIERPGVSLSTVALARPDRRLATGEGAARAAVPRGRSRRVGANLEEMHQGLAKLTRRPDVLIVYCGHNEFLTRYDSARDAGLQEAPLDPILDRSTSSVSPRRSAA